MDHADVLIQLKEEHTRLREEVENLKFWLEEENSKIKEEFKNLKRTIPEIEVGKFLFTGGHNCGAWGLGRDTGRHRHDRIHSVWIAFNRQFSYVPSVSVSSSLIDIEKRGVRFNLSADGITMSGFWLHIGTWWDSELHGIGVQWLAVSDQSLG